MELQNDDHVALASYIHLGHHIYENTENSIQVGVSAQFEW